MVFAHPMRYYDFACVLFSLRLHLFRNHSNMLIWCLSMLKIFVMPNIFVETWRFLGLFGE